MPRFLAKLLTFKADSIAGSAAVIAAASMVSRFLGVYRDRLLSGTFGAGAELDAYYAAFRFPDLAFNLLVLGAVGVGFIPVMSRYLKDDGDVTGPDAPSWAFVQKLVTVLGVVLAGASVACILLAPRLVPLLTPGFTPDNLAVTVRLTRIMLLGGVLLGLSSVIGSVLQSHRRFFAYAAAPVAYNLGIIAGITLLGRRLGVEGAAWGVCLGIALHFLIQYAAARAIGFRFRWRWRPRDAGVREVVTLAVPRTVSLALSQVNLMVVTGIASTVGVGALAVFTLAYNLQSFPASLIGISFAVASFPVVAALAARGDEAGVVREFGRLARTVLYLAIPATVIFLLLRAQAVRVVLGSGQFGWDDTVRTADALACFVVGLFAQVLVPLLARTFFALRDVKTTLWVGLAAIVVERSVAALLVARGLGEAGLALGVSVGAAVNVALLWVFLRRRLGPLEEGRTFRALVPMVFAALIAAAGIQASKLVVGGLVDMQTFLGVFTQGAVAGTVGVALYLALTRAFGLEEARLACDIFRRLARAAYTARGRRGARGKAECTVTTDLDGDVTGECDKS